MTSPQGAAAPCTRCSINMQIGRLVLSLVHYHVLSAHHTAVCLCLLQLAPPTSSLAAAALAYSIDDAQVPGCFPTIMISLQGLVAQVAQCQGRVVSEQAIHAHHTVQHIQLSSHVPVQVAGHILRLGPHCVWVHLQGQCCSQNMALNTWKHHTITISSRHTLGLHHTHSSTSTSATRSQVLATAVNSMGE